MTKFYSATTGGFYEPRDSKTMPSDAKEITDEVWRAIFDGLSVGMILQSDANGYPVALPPSLDSFKADKKQKIEEWRDIARCSDVVVEIGGVFHTWQADKVSKDLIGDTINLVSNNAATIPPVWRTIDNINVAVTLADLKSIASAMATQTNNAYIHSWQLKSLVDAATTKAQLEAIVW